MVEVLERKYISKQPIELPDGRQVPIILPDTDAKTHTSYLLFASLHSRL